MQTRLTLLATIAAALAFALVMLAAPTTVRAAGPCAWAGATSDDWHVSSNWNNCGSGLPGNTDDVRILAVARLPRVSAAATIHGLDLDAGAILTLANHANITLAGASNFSGTVRSQPGSQLTLAPDSAGTATRFLSPTAISGTLRLGGNMPNGSLVMANNSLLTVAPSGTLQVGVGVVSKAWTLQGRLDNHGTLELNKDLTLSGASAVHTNTGSIDLASGDMLIDLSSGSSSFSNQGTITVGASLTLTVNGGTFHHAGGNLNGAGNALFDQTTLDLAAPYSNTLPTLTLNRSVVQGSADIANIADQTLRAISTTIQTDVDNAGIFVVQRATSVAGHFTTHPGSTLRLESGTANAPAQFRVNESVTNLSVIAISATTGVSTTQYLFSTPRLTNTAGATVVVALAQAQAALDTTLVNQGMFNVGGATLLSPTNAIHSNSGTINVADSDLTILGNLSNSGVFNVGGAGLVAVNVPSEPAPRGSAIWIQNYLLTNLPGGTLNVLASATNGVSLTGRLNNQGAMNIAAPLAHNNQNVCNPCDYAILTNTGSISVHAASLTVAGDLLNLGTFTFDTSLFAHPPNLPQPNTSSWIIAGRIVNGGGNLTANAPNLPQPNAASWIIAGRTTLDAQFINAGTLAVNAPLTMPKAGSVHTNTGTINVMDSISITSDFNNLGTLTFGLGALVNTPNQPQPTNSGWLINGRTTNGGSGNLVVNGPTTFIGQLVNQGMVNINASFTLTNPNGVHTNTGTINLNAFDFEIGGGLNNSGVYNIGTPVVNAALAPEQADGFRIVSRSGLVANQPGGTLNIYHHAELEGAFSNQGTLNISATASISNPSGLTTNTGTLNLNGAALTTVGDFTNLGTFVLGTGAAANATNQPQPNGASWLVGGRATNGSGGTLRGNGTLSGDLTNGGTVAAGNSPGSLSIVGNYTQLPTGTLSVEIGGLTAGTQYDTLTVSGAVTLAGTLNLSLVHAFVPANGNAFTFLNAGSRSGSFTTVNGAILAGGKRFGLLYGGTFARAVALAQSLFLPLVVR